MRVKEKWKWSLSVMSDSVTPWTVAHQAFLSMEFSRQEYWNGLPFLTPGDRPNPGIKPASLASPALADSLYHCATWEAPVDPRGMCRYVYEGMCTKAQRERQIQALKPARLPTLLSLSRGLCRPVPWLLWLLVFADVNLNSQNLSVIVFRIVLLKVVGFNLLMTLRLWSSWGELTSQPGSGALGAGPQALKRNFPQALAFRA